jgi:hypothetical protein
LTDCHEPLIRLRQSGLSRYDADNVECHHTEAPKKYAKIIQINTKKTAYVSVSEIQARIPFWR